MAPSVKPPAISASCRPWDWNMIDRTALWQNVFALTLFSPACCFPQSALWHSRRHRNDGTARRPGSEPTLEQRRTSGGNGKRWEARAGRRSCREALCLAHATGRGLPQTWFSAHVEGIRFASAGPPLLQRWLRTGPRRGAAEGFRHHQGSWWRRSTHRPDIFSDSPQCTRENPAQFRPGRGNGLCEWH